MRRLAGIGAAALAVAILLLAAACSNGNKAGGGSANRTIVLTFASQIAGGQPDQLVRFANEVAKRSNGTIRIEFKGDWRANNPQQELATIRDVKAGKIDLAWVGARAWDWVGVHSFDALVAPLLIDSLPLEQKVFADRIPQRMLVGVRRAGVVGIGVLPGPMRKVLGVHKRLVAPRDFRGVTFGVGGIVAAETLRALGAHPRQLHSAPSLNGLGGIEEQMSAIEGNGHDAAGRFLSANLNLWPRPLVIFTSPKLLRSLTGAQRQALLAAAAAAVPTAMSASEAEDANSARLLCDRRKLAFLNLTDRQLQTMRQAVLPVYRRLGRDPGTRRTIRAIEALRQTAPGPRAIRCTLSSTSGPETATPIDGSWQMTVDQSQLIGNPAYGHPVTAGDVRLDIGTYRFVFRDGRVRQSLRGPAVGAPAGDTGTFRVDGDLVTIHITGGHDAGETWSYRWSIYRDELTFRKPPETAPQGPPNPMFAPWHRSSSAPTTAPRSGASQARQLDGVYVVNVARSDLARVGDVADAIPENLGHYVYVFDNGRFAFTQEDAQACTWQYGRYSVKGKLTSWTFIDGGWTKAPNRAANKPGEFFEFRWSLYRDTLTLGPVAGATSPPPNYVDPWHRVSTHPSRSYLSKDCPPPKAALP
jgi:TRAP-type C4-dicarboxylate transport system substrate-binding protein